MKNLFYVFILCVLLGCTENKKTIIIDNKTYTFIRAAHTNDNGLVDCELWERNGDTNRYYTPSLDGRSMMPLMR